MICVGFGCLYIVKTITAVKKALENATLVSETKFSNCYFHRIVSFVKSSAFEETIQADDTDETACDDQQEI